MMLGLIIMLGCSKEEQVSNPGQNDQKQTMVTHTLMVALSSIPDPALPHVECLPENSQVFLCGGGTVQGSASEIGNVIANESPWKVNTCEQGPGLDQLKEYISGKLTGVSGDYLNYSGVITIDLSDSSLAGYLYIEGGSGKFSRSSGRVDITGQVHVASNCFSWTGNGIIILWI